MDLDLDYRHRPPEPSPWPPSAVMRSAFALTVPFALVWAVVGVIAWEVVLSNYGATWPPLLHEPALTLAVAGVQAVLGAICAVGSRLFLWLLRERLRRRRGARRLPVLREIKTAQNWDDTDFTHF